MLKNLHFFLITLDTIWEDDSKLKTDACRAVRWAIGSCQIVSEKTRKEDLRLSN
jgi:hypothetical protein